MGELRQLGTGVLGRLVDDDLPPRRKDDHPFAPGEITDVGRIPRDRFALDAGGFEIASVDECVEAPFGVGVAEIEPPGDLLGGQDRSLLGVDGRIKIVERKGAIPVGIVGHCRPEVSDKQTGCEPRSGPAVSAAEFGLRSEPAAAVDTLHGAITSLSGHAMAADLERSSDDSWADQIRDLVVVVVAEVRPEFDRMHVGIVPPLGVDGSLPVLYFGPAGDDNRRGGFGIADDDDIPNTCFGERKPPAVGRIPADLAVGDRLADDRHRHIATLLVQSLAEVVGLRI
jgi:hypothetical protein